MRNELKLLFSLSCDGIGCTVVSEPAMNPVPGNGIDLGPLFATQMVKRQFKLVNRGKRHQQVSSTGSKISTRRLNRITGNNHRFIGAWQDMKNHLKDQSQKQESIESSLRRVSTLISIT